MRVFEIAKKIKMTSKELLAELKKMKIKVSNHMSSLEDADTEKIFSRFKVKSGTTSVAPEKKKTRVLIKKKVVSPPGHDAFCVSS